MPASFSSSSLSFDKLIGGNAALLHSRPITVISGQVITRGTVLGKITASSKYNKSLSAAVDGSEVPDLILAEDVDATAGDKPGLAYDRGDFNEGALVLGTAHTLASIREGLRDKGIILITAQGA